MTNYNITHDDKTAEQEDNMKMNRKLKNDENIKRDMTLF